MTQSLYSELSKLHQYELYDDLVVSGNMVLARSEHFTSLGQPSQFTPLQLSSIHLFLGDAYFNIANIKKAEFHYDESLEIFKGSRKSASEKKYPNISTAAIRLKLHKIYMKLRQYESALSNLKKIPTKERNPTVNIALAKLYEQMGPARSAEGCYKEVLRCCPLALNAAQGLIKLGSQRHTTPPPLINQPTSTLITETWIEEWLNIQLALVQKNYSTALSKYNTLRTQCAETPELKNLKGEIHYASGRLSLAERTWSEAHNADRAILANLDLLALIYFFQSDQTGLSNLMNSGAGDVTVNPERMEPWLISSLYSTLHHKHTDAIFLSQKALRHNPENYTALVVKAIALIKHQPEEALNHINRAIQLQPLRPEAYKCSISTLISTNRIREAISVGNIACKQIGTNALTYCMYGAALAKDHTRLERAVYFLESSVKMDPELFISLYKLAELLIKQSKYKKAIHVIEQGLKTRPTSRLYALHGEALLGTGEKMEAMTQFNLALGLDPHDKAAREGLDRLEEGGTALEMDSTTGEVLDLSEDDQTEFERLAWSDSDN